MQPMAQSTDDTGLTIVVYDPNRSPRHRQLDRATTLSHAARVSHKRRRSLSQKAEGVSTAVECMPSTKRTSGTVSASVATSPDMGQKRIRRLPHAVNHGNSDPFDSMAVCITPEVAGLLSLWKTHSGSNSVSTTRWLSETTKYQDLLLEDKLHATSLLFTCSALLFSRFSHRLDLEVKRLERKHDCFRQLKSGIRSHPSLNSKTVFVKGLALIFIAAVLSNEWVEAKLHAKQLCKGIAALDDSNSWATEQERIIVLSRVYYYDDQCALMYMRPPVLEASAVVERWETYLTPVRQWVQAQPPISGVVRHPALSRHLENLFIKLQEHVNIQCECIPTMSSSIKDHTFSSPLIYPIQLTGLFFNHLEFAKGQWIAQSGSNVLDEHRKWHTEIVLTLAALAFLTCAVYGPSIFSLQRRADKVMQALRRWLESAPNQVDGSPRLWIYQYSHLWAIYIGAVWEWDSGAYNAGDMWFSMRLQQETQRLCVESWSQLKYILDSFLCVTSQQLHGSVWFPGMPCPTGEPRSADQSVQTSADFLKALLFARTHMGQ